MIPDFAALPPEVNSTRIYTGPGAGPMLAAASAWDSLASQLESFASGYSSVLTDLHGQPWSGPSSDAMAAAAAPYAGWASTTAQRAEQAAGQARAAAAAYEAAFAATVPPAAVAANRAQLAMLVATNFFGQNTPAIAATEAAYAAMWAQDAAAMYGYAAAVQPAAALAPFTTPPHTTNAAGQAAHSAAAAHAASAAHTLAQTATAAPHQLHSLSTGSTASQSASPAGSQTAVNPLAGFNDFVKTYLSPWNNLSSFVYNSHLTGADVSEFGSIIALGARRMFLPEMPPLLLGEYALGGGGPLVLGERAFGSGLFWSTGEFQTPHVVLASAGKAASVGRLSVPQGWSSATLAADHTAGQRAVPAGLTGLKPGMDEPPVPPPGPMGSPAQHRTGTPVLRMRDRRFRMPRPAVGG